MTPDLLRRALAAHVPGTWPPPDRPDDLLRAVEALAEARPADRHLAALAREAARLASADRGLAPVVGGVRRERLVRWDADTTTWIGVRVETGEQALVRVIRPELDDGPLRRALLRDARALRSVVDALVVEGPAIAAPAPGQPLDRQVETSTAARTALVLGTVIRSLGRYEEAGLGLPALARDEVRVTPFGAGIVCLTPVWAPDPGPRLAWIAARLAVDEGALSEVLAGFAELPPRSAEEAEAHLIRALGQHLTGEWHALRTGWHRTAQADRIARLHDVLVRLGRQVPPPSGRGAVGVDLEGRITIVEGAPDRVTWGPPDAEELVWSPDGLDAPVARRLLRARAAAPPNARLHATVGGDPAYTEAIGRWLAAALRLRTVQLLLEKSLAS